MGTPLKEEDNNPFKEINDYISRAIRQIDHMLFRIYVFEFLCDFLNRQNKKEEKNMEEKDEFKIKKYDDLKEENEYTHPVLFKSFDEIDVPDVDTEGNVRDANEEEQTNKGILSRKPVGTIKSAPLVKIKNDYVRLRDNHIKIENSYERLKNSYDDVKASNKALKIELDEFKANQKIEQQRFEENMMNMMNMMNNFNLRLNEQKNYFEDEIVKLKQENTGLNNEIIKLKDVISARDKQIDGLNRTIDSQSKKIERLEREKDYLIREKEKLKSIQIPSLKINKMEELHVDKNEKMRPWNPLKGVRDTVSFFTPDSILNREKMEDLLRISAYNNDIERVEAMVGSTGTYQKYINGRGMPDSLCSTIRSFKDKTALMLAAQQGNLRCVQILVNSGAKINLFDRDKFTALDYAQQNRHLEISQFLIENGAVNAVVIPELNQDNGERLKIR